MPATQVETFAALVEVVQEHFGVDTQGEAAEILDLHAPQVTNWLKYPGPTKRTWKTLFRRLLAQSARELVWTLTEFEPVHPVAAGNGWRFFDDQAKEDDLRDKLDCESGLYVFYDSAGRVLYVGKTDNNVYVEAKQRLKAKPNHPISVPKKLKTPHVAQFTRFVSAYGVLASSATHNLETLLIRAFINDIGNANSGKFSYGR